MSLSTTTTTTTTTVQEPPAYDDDQYLPTYAESLRGARADGLERSPAKLRRKIRLANYGAASLNGPADQVTASPALLRRIQNELGQSLVVPPPTWGLEGASEYRQFRLNHGYDYRLRALLWEPSHVELGDVGFIDRRTGAFVKLLNAFNSDVDNAAHCGNLQSIPAVFGVGALHSLVGVERAKGSLKSKTLHWRARRASHNVWRGAKEAVVISEDDCFRYLNNTDRPQKWFQRSIDKILAAYGPTYGLQREDVIFVLGCLEAHNWAVCIGDEAQNVRVNVTPASQRQSGKEWATLADDKTSLPLPSASYRISASEGMPERPKSILLYGMHFVDNKVLTSI